MFVTSKLRFAISYSSSLESVVASYVETHDFSISHESGTQDCC